MIPYLQIVVSVLLIIVSLALSIQIVDKHRVTIHKLWHHEAVARQSAYQLWYEISVAGMVLFGGIRMLCYRFWGYSHMALIAEVGVVIMAGSTMYVSFLRRRP